VAKAGTKKRDRGRIRVRFFAAGCEAERVTRVVGDKEEIGTGWTSLALLAKGFRGEGRTSEFEAFGEIPESGSGCGIRAEGVVMLGSVELSKKEEMRSKAQSRGRKGSVEGPFCRRDGLAHRGRAA
jgi:hypothetical protein